MFWSRNKSTVTRIAGPMQKKIIHVGIENRSIIHARPVVVPKVSGIAGTDSSTEGIESANSVIIAMASAGPKSETKFRTLPLKNRVLMKPLNVFARKKVPNDRIIVISAVAAPTSTEMSGVMTEVSAYLYEGMSRDDAISWIMEYGLETRGTASQRLDFIDAQRAYVVTYNYGKRIVENYIGEVLNQDPEQAWSLFSEILLTPMMPADLLR